MPMGGVFLVVGVALTVVVVAALFNEQARIKRALRAARQTDIAHFPDNQPAKLVGALKILDQSLEAPLTGRRCAYYIAIVEQYRSGANNTGGSWHTIVKEESGVPFAIEDGSGRAIVDPSGARVALTIDSHSRSGTFDDATAAEEAFLRRHNRKSEGWFFNKKLRYREAVLEPDEQVAVLGRGVKEPDPDGVANAAAGYRSPPPLRVRVSTSTQVPLLISDDPTTLA